MKSIAFCCSAAAAVALLISLAAIPSGCYAGEPQSPNSFPTAAQDPLPNGYSTFALAPAGMKPPKVRKPPYLPLSLECPGLHDGTGLIARNNLCGDLNQGLIPRNPMGQSALGQPYPFELLKNKTLQFLSRTLPYLKEEIESIPKVARFVKPSEFFEKNQSSRRYARSIASSSSSSVVGDPSGQDLSSERSSALLNGTLAKTAVGTAAKSSPISVGGGGEVKGIPEVKEVNITKLSRQQLCEGNVLCQALESLREDGLLSKSFLSNVVSAVGNVASGGGGGGTGSTGSSAGALSSLLEQLTFPSAAADNSSKSGAGSSLAANRNKLATLMTLSQLLPSLTSSSSSSSASDSNGGTPTSGDGSSSSSSSNAYSPLLSIIDYLQSLQSPKMSSSYYPGGATKRKSTVDQQPTEPEFNLQSGGTGPDPSAQTPCASKEEYISPTYARNYQGVWKYVVQIPNEGYFTQTVQQTTCLKTRCDLVEGGACRESPRWVSLLVAEIFYPNVYFPVNQLMPMLYQKQQQQQQQQQNQQATAASQPAPTSYHPHHHPQQLSQSSAASQSSLHHQYQVLNSNHHSSQQIKRQQTAGGGGHAYLRPGAQQQQQQLPQLNQLTKAELAALVNMLKRSDNGQVQQQQPSHPGLANVELLARRARVAKLAEAETKAVPSSEEVLGDSLSSSGDSSSLSNKGGGGEAGGGGQQQQQHCDGYDKIGCYVVRVYYDWFLVNGSCKCWKATGSGGHGSGLNINETIKRIFIGKWKKK